MIGRVRRVRLEHLTVAERALLEDRARRLALSEPATAATGARLTLVAFRLLGHALAVEASGVRIAQPLAGKVTPLAGAPAGVAGLALVESAPTLVVDLARALGQPRSRGALASAPLLCLVGADPVAVAVEGPLELLDVDGWLPLDPRLQRPHDMALAGRVPDGPFVVEAGWLAATVAGWCAQP